MLRHPSWDSVRQQYARGSRALVAACARQCRYCPDDAGRHVVEPVFRGLHATLKLVQFGRDIAAHKRDTMHMPHYYLLMAAVNPDIQGSGVLSALVQFTLNQIDPEKCRSIWKRNHRKTSSRMKN